MIVEYIRYRICDPGRRAEFEKASAGATFPEGGRRP
jgi:hypothetical protein